MRIPTPTLKLQQHSMLAPPFNSELVILRLSQTNLERGRSYALPPSLQGSACCVGSRQAIVAPSGVLSRNPS